ncbi:hypothetical protein GCM10009744_55550 [Kribbella alba]|uniref:Uncharacterized protein n=1 Tax=Kribbella alba TaxID=190197 RepID=A0ABP4RK37_9ACTN
MAGAMKMYAARTSEPAFLLIPPRTLARRPPDPAPPLPRPRARIRLPARRLPARPRPAPAVSPAPPAPADWEGAFTVTAPASPALVDACNDSSCLLDGNVSNGLLLGDDAVS